ncbi:MAG: OmpA family protein, partial [Pseudomonadota bacterium]
DRAAELSARLSEAEEVRLAEVAAAQALRDRLANAETELDAATLALEEQRAKAAETLELLAAAEIARRDLTEEALAAASKIDAEEALRRVAEDQLARAEALTKEEQRKVAALAVNVQELQDQLQVLQGLLDDSNERDRKANVQIAELQANLNQALAQKVSELSRFRSEFFGRMREVLGRQQGVETVGDRFVFQSEVLFGSGTADLGAPGQAELSKLADIIRELSSRAPPDLNWVLRVDGHTDKLPLSGAGRYRDNWELSQARALSVVRYLVEVEGIPETRLAATGFGEHQPIYDGDDRDLMAANRRIEFKFTER